MTQILQLSGLLASGGVYTLDGCAIASMTASCNLPKVFILISPVLLPTRRTRDESKLGGQVTAQEV